MSKIENIKAKEPNYLQERKAKEIYINKYNELRLNQSTNGFVPRAKLMDLLLELGVWNDEKQKQVDEINQSIKDTLQPIKDGGVSLEDAKKAALKVQNLRLQLNIISSVVSSYDADFTFESYADEAKRQYLLLNCVVDEKGKKVFNTEKDIANAESDILIKANEVILQMLYGSIKDIYKSLPENEFLMDYGFMDEDLKSTEEPVAKEEKRPFLDEKGEPVKPVK